MDPNDPLSARLVAACGLMLTPLEAFDALGIVVRGPAKAQADGILKCFGPAAVFCAILQGSEQARALPAAEQLVDRFAQAAVHRRQALLGALPTPQRVAVEAAEAEHGVGPHRVLELFTQALAGLDLNAVVKRWGSGGGLKTLGEQVGRAARGEAVDTEALQQLVADHKEARESLPAPSEPLPVEALSVVGSVLAGIGADEGMLHRVMSSALPVDAPSGFTASPMGTLQRDQPKVRRNDPCPCGSGRKHKACCGRAG